MKTKLHSRYIAISTIAIILLSAGLTMAQVQPVPYSTGFDNVSQQNGWQEFRKGTISVSEWSYASAGAFSPPTAVNHDYPVGGTSTDTVADWFVSPPLNGSSNLMIALQMQVYSITGSTTPADNFSLWIGEGNADPALGNYTSIADFTTLASSQFGLWRDTAINFTPSNDTFYVAFKYKATDNWFTIGLDDVGITFAADLNDASRKNSSSFLFPDPSGQKLHVTSDVLSGNTTVTVFNLTGEIISEEKVHSVKKTDVDIKNLPPGVYFLQLQHESKNWTGRFVKQ